VLHDAEGTEVHLWCRVEQLAVDKAAGAEPDRLHELGKVIGHSAHLVWVKFDHGSQTPIPLRAPPRACPRRPGGFLMPTADQPSSGFESSGPSGVRQQCSSHRAAATSAPAHTAPITAAAVSEAAEGSWERSGST